MKKNKLSLKSLEVQSFVTSLNGSSSKTIKGGESDNGACGPSAACGNTVVCATQALAGDCTIDYDSHGPKCKEESRC